MRLWIYAPGLIRRLKIIIKLEYLVMGWIKGKLVEIWRRPAIKPWYGASYGKAYKIIPLTLNDPVGNTVWLYFWTAPVCHTKCWEEKGALVAYLISSECGENHCVAVVYRQLCFRVISPFLTWLSPFLILAACLCACNLCLVCAQTTSRSWSYMQSESGNAVAAAQALVYSTVRHYESLVNVLQWIKEQTRTKSFL
jgi:hypothetical protein